MDQTKRVPFQAAKQLKGIMAKHFMELDEASRTKNRKIAWCTSVGPAELALAFDFLVYYPENHTGIGKIGRDFAAADFHSDHGLHEHRFIIYHPKEKRVMLQGFQNLWPDIPAIRSILAPEVGHFVRVIDQLGIEEVFQVPFSAELDYFQQPPTGGHLLRGYMPDHKLNAHLL